jgi:hypothetical protein
VAFYGGGGRKTGLASTRLGWKQARYRLSLLEPLAQASGGHDLPLADLTGCFVQSGRNALYKQGLS